MIPARDKSELRHVLGRVALLLGLYGLLSYIVVPQFWKHYEHQPAMEGAPKTTETAQGIPGDPLNVGLVGTKEEVIRAMLLAGWEPADPITLKSSMHIAESVVLNRAYTRAPVSNLYLWGRKQDLAFEKESGKSARHRQHVRFWRSNDLAVDGRTFWIGSASYDKSVGFSHRTGQLTHHIAPDVDAERDSLIADLKKVDQLSRTYDVTGVGATMTGRNGEGDWYYTDGELEVGVLWPENEKGTKNFVALADPLLVQMKDKMFLGIRNILERLPVQGGTEEPGEEK